MRDIFRRFLSLALRIFFRKIEIAGKERVPSSGPVIFVVNHPNGLVDPLFLLCLAPRRVSFLAKEPLFRMPLIGFFVRAFDSIPVHRREDAGDLSKNQETFASARAVLARGGAIAIFPEGGSHDEPRLKPLKSGAARIALGAAAGSEAPLTIVPAVLFYTAKQKFRSRALLGFGDGLTVRSPEPFEGDPSPAAVRELTSRIEAALAELALQAESRETLELVATAQRVFSWDGDGLSRELELRRRFVDGAARLSASNPERFAALRQRIAAFERERREAGLSLRDLKPGGLTTGAVFRLLGSNALALLLSPFAAVGAVLHYPAYRLAGGIARRLAKEDAVASTFKVGSSLLLFPATWIASAVVAGMLWGWRGVVAALVLVPASGYAALRAREALDAVVGRAKALLHFSAEGYATRRLLAERGAIREEIVKIAEELGMADGGPPPEPAR